MKHKLLASAMTGAIALTMFNACSSDEDEGQTFAKPEVTFSLNGNFVPTGGRVNFTWSVDVATEIRITQSGGYPDFVTTELEGTRQSEPINEDTEFFLTAVNGDQETVSETLTVTVQGIRIDAFGANPAEIEVGGTTTLSWQITGGTPTTVTITDDTTDDPNPVIYNQNQPFGMIQVSPEITTTYSLTAVGETTLTQQTTVTVTENTLAPAIDSFTANPTEVVLDQQQVDLRWTTRNADEIRILEIIDGNEREIRRWSNIGAAAGNFRSFVTAPTVEFRLEARNNTATIDTESVTVRGLVGPSITGFSVDPVGYTTASTVATVTWTTENADSVQLRLNDRPVAGFPTDQVNGSFQVTIAGGNAVLALTATNMVATTNPVEVTVSETFDEPEPNGDAATALVVTPNGIPNRGTISDATDVDWYRFEVTENDSLLYAQAGWTPNGGCGIDSILRLYDSNGTLLGLADDPTWPQLQQCAQIHPNVQPFASGLAAGTYYLSVGGTGNQPTGVYSVFIDARGPTAPPPNSMITRVGSPSWDVTDTQLVSIPIPGGDPGFFTEMMQPYHGFDQVVAGQFLLFGHVNPHAIPYDRELQGATMAAGLRPKSTFTQPELDQNNAVFLMVTLVATGTAAVGTSPDFTFPGLIIRNSQFPIVATLQVQLNGAPWQAANLANIPSYTMWPVTDPPSPIGPPAVPGDGSSHRHLVFPASELTAGAPATPGTYTFIVTLRDSTTPAAGYDLNIPFTVQ